MTSTRLDDWYSGHLTMIAEERSAREEAEKKMLVQLGLAREA